MAASLVFMLIIGWFLSASALDKLPTATNADVHTAVREMQGANYFTFVTLINMVQDKIPGNATLLVPDDELLSDISIAEDKVMEFLSRHLIPSRLLFSHLVLLPSGTVLPTNQQGYALAIFNNGKMEFQLNNVQLTTPDICVSGSITCHGIKGVLMGTSGEMNSCFHPNHSAAEPSTSPQEKSTGFVNLTSRMNTVLTSCMSLFLTSLF